MKWLKAALTDLKTLATIVGSLMVVIPFFWIIYGHFYTDAEAAVHQAQFMDYQQQQYNADKNDRVDRMQREIDRIDYQLLDTSLDSIKREYLLNKRKDIERKIECIRRDEC